MSSKLGTTGAVLGIVASALAILVSCNELGAVDLFPRMFTSSPCGAFASAEITLSAGSAPRGGRVTVHGSCFDAGERVAIRVHVTEVGSATADSKGSFKQTITIPESAPPAGFPTSVVATGRSSVKTATAPFSTA